MSIDFTDVPTSELIEAFNATADRLGHNPVKKFADRETAERRTRMAISSIIDPALRPGRWMVTNDQGAKHFQQSAIDAHKNGDPEYAAKMNETAARHAQDEVPSKDRLAEAARQSIAEAEGPKTIKAPEVKAALPIPSDDPAKDAEMPTLRRALKLLQLEPKKTVYARKASSKQALLVDLLSRKDGVTFGELYDALAAGGKPWRGVTIRSGLAWDINHIAGYGVASTAYTGMEFAAMGRVYEAERLGVKVHTSQDDYGVPTAAYDPAFKLLVYRLTYPKGQDVPLPHTPTAAMKKAAAAEAVAAALANGGKV